MLQVDIAFTEKKQVQLRHYKEGNMHYTIVIHSPNEGESVYLYHLSDDTTQDSAFTFSIIRDIIHHHPEVIQKGFLILHS